MAARARVGDTSSHRGTIISGSPDTFDNGLAVARAGDLHDCPIHRITPLIPSTTKTYVNGRLVITVGAKAACGAVITSGSPDVNAE